MVSGVAQGGMSSMCIKHWRIHPPLCYREHIQSIAKDDSSVCTGVGMNAEI